MGWYFERILKWRAYRGSGSAAGAVYGAAVTAPRGRMAFAIGRADSGRQLSGFKFVFET